MGSMCYWCMFYYWNHGNLLACGLSYFSRQAINALSLLLEQRCEITRFEFYINARFAVSRCSRRVLPLHGSCASWTAWRWKSRPTIATQSAKSARFHYGGQQASKHCLRLVARLLNIACLRIALVCLFKLAKVLVYFACKGACLLCCLLVGHYGFHFLAEI